MNSLKNNGNFCMCSALMHWGKNERLRVSENRVLRIFGSKRDKVTGIWR
jgi:hypothetical protein